MKIHMPRNGYERQMLELNSKKVPDGWDSFGMIEGNGAILVKNKRTGTFAAFDPVFHKINTVDQRAAKMATELSA